MAVAAPPKPRRPPESMLDPVTVYALDVDAGRIVTGNLVKLAARRHLRDLQRDDLEWRPVTAQKRIDFFPALLRHYKGEWGPRPPGARGPDDPGKLHGDPVVLGGWQQFLVGSAFGWFRWDADAGDWVRRFRHVYVEVAKKNGKTLLGAGVGLQLAFFDDEPGAEVYSAATKRDQAKLVWLDAKQMVRKSPALRRRIMAAALSLFDPNTASFFRPLGADAGGDQGINAHGGIIDELHVHKNREVIDNIDTATSARSRPMQWTLTTAGTKKAESPWQQIRADMVAIVEGRAEADDTLVYIATLDDGDDPFDERVWPKANPNLGVSVSLQTLREQAAKAQRSPGALGGYLRFRMNVPTQTSTRWFSIDVWDTGKGAPQVADGDSCFAGLDLATVRDLTAFIKVFRAPDGVYDVVCRFWCPQEGIDLRSQRDGVPYDRWVQEGWITATPGNVTDYDQVFADISGDATTYYIGEIGYDRWNATHLATMLTADGAQMVPISQTYAGLSAACKELEKAILSGRIRHGGNPVLRWMAGNVELEVDANENIRPSKAKSTERIDGIVGLVMGIQRWLANGEPAVMTAL